MPCLGAHECQGPPGLARPVLVIAGVKGKVQTSKPFLLSPHLPPAGKEPFLLTLVWLHSCPSCFRSCIPSAYGAILPLWNVFHVNLCFTKLNMLFLTLLLSSLWSVFHLLYHLPAFPYIHARLSLSILTLRRQTHSQWHQFLSIFAEISLLIHPRIAFAFLCLTSQSAVT